MKTLYDDDILEYQDDDDLSSFSESNIIVYSRDWTVETIFNQIEQGNIDLNPGFQRRNAWKDAKRSKLIESILLGFPVPEIVLAEDKNKKGSFIVIDGKQRLLTLAGFINNEKYEYWDNPKLANIKDLKELSGKAYTDLMEEPLWKRSFENTSLRCTVIANYSNQDVLYDIFYRLNAGATPLSSQELRQALNKGGFSDFLIEVTEKGCTLQDIMNVAKPDNRLRDVENLLRIMAFLRYAKDYKGNLRKFLDEKMSLFNSLWNRDKTTVKKLYKQVDETLQKLTKVFVDKQIVGRRYKDGKFEAKFNRVIVEVEVFYFLQIDQAYLTTENNRHFIEGFKSLCTDNRDFLLSIEASTKNMDNYMKRYACFQDLVNSSYNINLKINPYVNIKEFA